MADLEELKRKRNQLTARIQAAEAKERGRKKREEDRVKILVGAAVLEQVKNPGKDAPPTITEEGIFTLMDKFLERTSDREAVLGKDGRGSEAFLRSMGDKAVSQGHINRLFDAVNN